MATPVSRTNRCCAASRKPTTAFPLRGLEWLNRNFSVSSNPTEASARARGFSQSYLLYYLYGVERVGRMTANRFIGQHDWYREGSEMLVRTQDRISGSWKGVGVEMDPQIATSLSLLFLSKGRRPVVAAKFQTGDDGDWNRHRSDLAHLTHDVERRWQRDLTWQIIDGDAATLEDLLQTPVSVFERSRRPELAARAKAIAQAVRRTRWVHLCGILLRRRRF